MREIVLPQHCIGVVDESAAQAAFMSVN